METLGFVGGGGVVDEGEDWGDELGVRLFDESGLGGVIDKFIAGWRR